MRKNEKGFTLVELLAVIVILGLLMAIAIPSVTKYITQSRVKTLTKTMDSYVTAVVTQVNDGEYKFSDSTKIFAIPIECVSLEKGGTDPFGNWLHANEAYWAYVLVHYDSENYNYEYGFTFKDDAGYGLYPTINDKITDNLVRTGYDDLTQPKDGLASNFVPLNKWEGFTNITSTTELVVLEAESDGIEGNGQTTCTLCQKGDNYVEVEKEENIINKVSTLAGTTWKFNDVISGYQFLDTFNYFEQTGWEDFPYGCYMTNGNVTINIWGLTKSEFFGISSFGPVHSSGDAFTILYSSADYKEKTKGWYVIDNETEIGILEGTITDLDVAYEKMVKSTSPTIVFSTESNSALENTELINWFYENAVMQ